MTEERTVEAADDCQLDLFGWERIKLGEGYAALARLELERAAAVFGDLLRQKPDFTDAKEGCAMAMAWGDVLWEMETRSQETAAAFLWERIRSYSFGPWGGDLRKALVRRLIAVAGRDADFYAPPDFCLGVLHLEVGEHERAEASLRGLLQKHPDDARLLLHLGNALFLQRRASEARVFYAKALLGSPAVMGAAGWEDGEVAALIRETGPQMAPVHGWLRGILPMVDVDVQAAVDQGHERTLRVYRALLHAESARMKRDHRGMVEHRRFLKDTAPEILEAYLRRIV